MKVKYLFVDWIKISVFVVSVLSLSSCDDLEKDIPVFIIVCACLSVLCFLVAKLMINWQRKLDSKKTEKEKARNNEIIARQKEEVSKLQSCDTNYFNSLPFVVDFKKKYKKDFFEFCKDFRLRSLHEGGISAITEDKDMYEMLFSDDCFMLIHGYFTCSFTLLFNSSNEIEYTLNKYKANFSMNDFEILSYDEIIYIETFIEKGEDIELVGKQPSNLNLAVTEELFGTAAAMRKANQAPLTWKTSDKVKYKLVFSTSSNLRPVIIDRLSLACYYKLQSKFLKLLEEKTKHAYLIKNKNSSNTMTQTNNLDELKKLKELLDAGIITQEEFDAKKKQILGL